MSDSNESTQFPDGPPQWPQHQRSEIREALLAAWSDGSWGRYHGPHIPRLINALTEMHDVDFAMVCCSGTAAVEWALRAVPVNAGDEVILAGYDFPGNFRCIEAVGARPVLVDLAAESWCLDADQIQAAAGPQTRAVLVSHLHGTLADMRTIRRVADELKLAVIEDACQVIGAEVQGRPAGSWGDVGVLSFGGSKLVTAGRGGALLSNRADVVQRAKIFAERGNELLPLSELQAAVLLPQLEGLPAANATRRERVDQIRSALETHPLLAGRGREDRYGRPAYYKLAWTLDCQQADRDSFTAAARRRGVALDAGFRGFVRRSTRRCRQVGELSRSAQAAQSTVLLHHPILLEAETEVQKLTRILTELGQP